MSLKSTTSALTTAAIAVFTPTTYTPELKLKPDADVLVGGSDRQAWAVASGVEFVLHDLFPGDTVYVKTATGTGNVEVLVDGQ